MNMGSHRQTIRPARVVQITVVLLALCGIGCGIVVARRFGQASMNEIIYDDKCDLQEYFDRIEMGIIHPPAQVQSSELERTQGKRASGGISSYAFTSDGQLAALRKMLAANWRRIPEEVKTAERIEVEVRWSERAENRFVVMDQDAELRIGRQGFALPYHHCLSALLFGEALYHMRREMVGLPPLPSFDKSGKDAGSAMETAAPIDR
jgi:hypothetical protein